MFINKHFAYLDMGTSQKVKDDITRTNVRGADFYMKTNVLQNFHNCISVPNL